MPDTATAVAAPKFVPPVPDVIPASRKAVARAETELPAPVAELKIEDASARVARLQKRLGYNVPAITLVMLTELGVDGVAFSVLYPLVVDRVHHIMRETTRRDYDLAQRESTAEKRDRAGGKGKPRPQSVMTPDIRKDKLAFLNFKVIMAGVPAGFKLYKDLSVAEHESRKMMLLRSAEPMIASANGHAWAKEMCEKHKVANLGAIPWKVLEEELPKDGVRP